MQILSCVSYHRPVFTSFYLIVFVVIVVKTGQKPYLCRKSNDMKDSQPQVALPEGLTLRCLTPEDRALHKTMSENIVATLVSPVMLIPMTDAEYDETYTEQSEDVVYGILDAEGRLVATSSLLHNVVDYAANPELSEILKHRCVEIGESMVLPEYRGNGYMLMLNRLIKAEAIKQGMEYMLATAHPDNIASNKSLRKLGYRLVKTFDRHGYLRNLYVMKLHDVSDWDAETERRVARGVAFFKQGYNCSQSVAMTFADWYEVPVKLIARISASYGGGIGRMRETCGSALGIFMLAGLEVASEPADATIKGENYAVVQQLAADFKAKTGSLICKELLGLNKQRADGTIPEIVICATPEARTDEYYKKRPCIRMVETAIRIYMDYLRSLN